MAHFSLLFVARRTAWDSERIGVRRKRSERNARWFVEPLPPPDLRSAGRVMAHFSLLFAARAYGLG